MYLTVGENSADQTHPRDPLLRTLVVRFMVGLAISLLVVAVCSLPVVRTFEDRVLDVRIHLWRELVEPDTRNFLIVTIDNRSLASAGLTWPLPPDVYARAILALREAGARAIGVTVPFDTP